MGGGYETRTASGLSVVNQAGTVSQQGEYTPTQFDRLADMQATGMAMGLTMQEDFGYNIQRMTRNHLSVINQAAGFKASGTFFRKSGDTSNQEYAQIVNLTAKASRGEEIAPELMRLHEQGALNKESFAAITNLQSWATNPSSSLRSPVKLAQTLQEIVAPLRSPRTPVTQQNLEAIDVGGVKDITSVIQGLVMQDPLKKGFAMGGAEGAFSYRATGEGVGIAQQKVQASLQDSTKNLQSAFENLNKTVRQTGAGFLWGRRKQETREFETAGQALGAAKESWEAARALHEELGVPMTREQMAAGAAVQDAEVTMQGYQASGIGQGRGGIGGFIRRFNEQRSGGGTRAPIVSRAANLFGGFELMYISRMMNFATGAMGRGMGSLAQQQAALQGGLFAGGAMPAGYQGALGEAVARQGRQEAAWANMGRQVSATYSPLLDFGATLPGQKTTGFAAAVLGPTLAATMAGTHFGQKLLGSFGAIAGGTLAGVGSLAYTGSQWLRGQGEEQTIGDDYMAFLAGKEEWNGS